MSAYTNWNEPNIPIINQSSTNLVNSDFHPSVWENDKLNINSNLKNNRTLLSINQARDDILGTNDISKLISSGSYKLTAEDGDTKVSGSNTRFLFKNLYGETLLTFLFFSGDNIKNIQNLIKMLVYQDTKQLIDNQSDTELMITMRSIFLAYSEHPKLIDPLMSDKEILMPTDYLILFLRIGFDQFLCNILCFLKLSSSKLFMC